MENSVLFHQNSHRGRGNTGNFSLNSGNNFQYKRVRLNHFGSTPLGLASNIPIRYSTAKNQYVIQIPVRIHHKDQLSTYTERNKLIITGIYLASNNKYKPFREEICLPSNADPHGITTNISKNGITIRIPKKKNQTS